MMKILFIFLIAVSTLWGQLKSPNNQADYIIIYHPKFESGLTDFVSWRESKGLSVNSISVDAIYQEFPDSNLNSQKIKSFVDYAYDNWQEPKPQYLLLIGDVEYVPSLKIKSNIPDHEYLDKDSVSVDGLYVTNNSTQEVQMAIGRIPCNTNIELQNCIEKSILFEEASENYNKHNKFVVLADTDSTLGNMFEYRSDNLVSKINEIDNSIFEFERINIDSTSLNYKTSEELLNTISIETILFHFIGHGNPFTWSLYHYLTTDDFENLISNSFPFLFTAVACSQNFDVPDSISIVEKLLLMNGRGSAASITSSGANMLMVGSNFFEKFYQKIIEDKNLTIGQAVVKTKNEIYNSEYVNRFTILGDPALKIPLQIIADVYDNSTIPEEFVLEQNYPNPFNPTTNIKFTIITSSLVELSVYNLLGQKVGELVNENLSAGQYEVNFNGQDLTSGIYFYSLKTNEVVQTKKMTLIK